MGRRESSELFRSGESVLVGFYGVSCEARVIGSERGRVLLAMPNDGNPGESLFAFTESLLMESMRVAHLNSMIDRIHPDPGTLVDIATIEARLAVGRA